MSKIEISNFPSVTQDELNNLGDVLAQWVIDNYPNIDISRGSAFYNILIKPAALVYSLINNQSELTKQATTLLGNTDENQIENILANLFINRDSGNKAKGLLNVELKNDIDTVIGTANIFSANSLDYYPIQEYAYTAGDGQTITIEVEASESGSEYNVSENTLFVSDNTNVYSAITPNNILNGQDKENIDDVIDRARTSFATRGFYNKKSIKATLQEEFSNVHCLYIAGFGDAAMTRDVGSFGVHSGSMVDIYLRTTIGAYAKTITKTVTSSKISMDSDSHPPILDIISVSIDNAEVKDYTVSRTTKDTVHSVDNPRYTSFENIEIIFLKNEYDGKSATISYRTMPDICTIQEYVDSDNVKNLMADVLIKSVIPYYVNVQCEYSLINGATLTTQEIETLIANAINTMNNGILNVSYINSNLYNNDVIAKTMLVSTINYNDTLTPITTILNTTYRNYNDARISFFSNSIKTRQL